MKSCKRVRRPKAVGKAVESSVALRSLHGGLRKKIPRLFSKYNRVLYKQFKIPRKYGKTYINVIFHQRLICSSHMLWQKGGCLSVLILMQISRAGLENFFFKKHVLVCENKLEKRFRKLLLGLFSRLACCRLCTLLTCRSREGKKTAFLEFLLERSWIFNLIKVWKDKKMW